MLEPSCVHPFFHIFDHWSNWSPDPSKPRAYYLAVRNAADGSKAYCSYCGRPASSLDGESCPGCGATEVDVRRPTNA